MSTVICNSILTVGHFDETAGNSQEWKSSDQDPFEHLLRYLLRSSGISEVASVEKSPSMTQSTRDSVLTFGFLNRIDLVSQVFSPQMLHFV
jgi:hypothetical protein